MASKTILDQARFIFTVGKSIHDRVYEAGARYFSHPNGSKESVELSFPQKNMLMIIHRHKSMTITDLALQLGVSPPSASAMVDRLVEKGILTREHSTKDRRKVVVRISAEAISMLDGMEASMLGFFIEVVEKVGPQTAQKWCQVLGEVKAILESDDEKEHIVLTKRRIEEVKKFR